MGFERVGRTLSLEAWEAKPAADEHEEVRVDLAARRERDQEKIEATNVERYGSKNVLGVLKGKVR